MGYTEGTPVTFRTPAGTSCTATFVKYAATPGMVLLEVTAPGWTDDPRILISENDIISPAEALLTRGDVVLDNVGELHVIIRVDSAGTMAEVLPGATLPDKIPNRSRGDWRNVSQLKRLDTGTCQVGDAVTIDGINGVWLVTDTESDLIQQNPALVGIVRVEKVFDGAGPLHLTANVPVADLRTVKEDSPPLLDQVDPGDEPLGVRLTARHGEVVVPMHPAAYASAWYTCQAAGHLQARLDLTADAHIVQWSSPWQTSDIAKWLRVDAPAPTVPADVMDAVAHNHAYYDDGVTPAVGPCRHLSTCRSSLAIVEALEQTRAGQPRFATLDLDALRAARAEVPGDEAEYGLRYTRHGEQVESTVLVPGLAAAARAVRATREVQAALGDPIDAVLIARRPATDILIAGDWCEVHIEPGAVGEPGTLLAP